MSTHSGDIEYTVTFTTGRAGSLPPHETGWKAAETYAVDLIRDGQTIGLGSGRAALGFVRRLGERVRDGLHIQAVPTSLETRQVAREEGILLVPLAQVEVIDLSVDGADEVDPSLNLIKGYGGALLKEKVVAALSRRRVIVVGPEKQVPVLGTRGRLPVEIVPFAGSLITRRLEALGLVSSQRWVGNHPFITESGNWILDCVVQPLENPAALESQILSIPGVVEVGLFLGLTEDLLVAHSDHLEILERAV